MQLPITHLQGVALPHEIARRRAPEHFGPELATRTPLVQYLKRRQAARPIGPTILARTMTVTVESGPYQARNFVFVLVCVPSLMISVRSGKGCP